MGDETPVDEIEGGVDGDAGEGDEGACCAVEVGFDVDARGVGVPAWEGGICEGGLGGDEGSEEGEEVKGMEGEFHGDGCGEMGATAVVSYLSSLF